MTLLVSVSAACVFMFLFTLGLLVAYRPPESGGELAIVFFLSLLWPVTLSMTLGSFCAVCLKKVAE